MAKIQSHIIRPLGLLGPPADARLQSNTRYPLGEREMQTKNYPLGEREVQTKPFLSPWGTETRQRHRGHWVLSIHKMKLNTLKVCRPCGLGRTIGTVTVICGNNPEGFTFRAPSRQSGNLQQHEAANQCSKQFLSAEEAHNWDSNVEQATNTTTRKWTTTQRAHNRNRTRTHNCNNKNNQGC
jgi:hypothetical protein